MKIQIAGRRKDGKWTADYSFSNGVHIRKILTSEKLIEEIHKLGPKYADVQITSPGFGHHSVFIRHYEQEAI